MITVVDTFTSLVSKLGTDQFFLTAVDTNFDASTIEATTCKDDEVEGVFRDRRGLKNANAIVFVINGVAIMALEDHNDGYRSSMRWFAVLSGYKPKNPFEPCHLMCHEDASNTNDITKLVDVHTQKLVIEVGTGDYANYYPYFVAAFHPENMWININVESASSEELVKRLAPPEYAEWGAW